MIKSITKKQIDTMLKDIITKIGKMSSASDEVVGACEAQLQEIVLKLTQLLTRKKEELVIYEIHNYDRPYRA